MAAVSGPVGCLSYCLFRGMAAVQVQQLAAPVGQGGQAGPRRVEESKNCLQTRDNPNLLSS